MNEAVNGSNFGLKGIRACISGMKNKEKYMDYQNNYREMYGVYPELDRIHNPYTARFDDVYQICCFLRKSGFYGALYYHDLHNRYRRRLKRIYENYSKEWSFFISIDLEHRTTLTDIQNMPPSKIIVDNLGYYKAENGNYYEGTWANGSLIYGIVYLAKQNVFFTGSFDETGCSDCCGVTIDLGEIINKKRQVTTMAGKFRIKNGQISLYDSDCLINKANINIKKNDLSSFDSYLGQYVEGYAEGTFINKEFSDDIRIGWDKYRDGEIKSSISSIELLPRTLMMFYMLVWYLVKYVYGIMFFITPLYYILRKKNWKI